MEKLNAHLEQVGGEFRTIIADPPWAYRSSGGNGGVANHYATMSEEELCALPVKAVAAQDCVLLMWATWPQLEVAMRLIPAWGFQFVTGFPWVKTSEPPFCDLLGQTVMRPSYGTGWWVRGCSEPILVCKRGNVTVPAQSWLGLISERMSHSRKPDTLYEYAESFPAPRLELFARRPRFGWTVWGNEVVDC
jgi:N6-adenosine-specific RNA methylase IME4